MTRSHIISGHGDLSLSVQDWGPLDAPAIILLHGWSQCHLAFARQTPLADKFRLILPDLRGHGASQKPLDTAAYDHSTPWAHDIAAIIAQLNLVNPLLMGWSMGGWVVMDYVQHFGDAGLAGTALIGSSVTTGKFLPPAAAKVRNNPDARAVGMYSDDLAENLETAVTFVKTCFHQQPDADTLAAAVGYNMLVPPMVRKAARLRQQDHRPTAASTTKPCLVAWGAHEKLAPAEMGEEALSHLPFGQRLTFENSGHCPFWEEADKFNTELARFADSCFMTSKEAAA